jgi:hypothetical protein
VNSFELWIIGIDILVSIAGEDTLSFSAFLNLAQALPNELIHMEAHQFVSGTAKHVGGQDGNI